MNAALRRRWLWTIALLAAAGCASAPRAQLDEARGQVHALRTELAQAKDVAAKLRTQNRDVASRTVDDSGRLAALEEANARLERSVAAYQEEREQYAAALDQIKRDVASAVDEAGQRK